MAWSSYHSTKPLNVMLDALTLWLAIMMKMQASKIIHASCLTVASTQALATSIQTQTATMALVRTPVAQMVLLATMILMPLATTALASLL